MTPVFNLLAANAEITALIGVPPAMRCYSAGNIPESPAVNAALPCVTQQTISGQPQNNLAKAPAIDGIQVFVNVWALTAVGALHLMELVRDTLEADGTNVMTNAPQDSYEPDTKRFGWLMEFFFWIPR